MRENGGRGGRSANQGPSRCRRCGSGACADQGKSFRVDSPDRRARTPENKLIETIKGTCDDVR